MIWLWCLLLAVETVVVLAVFIGLWSAVALLPVAVVALLGGLSLLLNWD